MYILTNQIPEALIFAAMAPASAPAGAVAVIHEYKAKGKLTSSILAVVGFDDGFAIIIYAFAIAFAGIILSSGAFSFSNIIITPIIEIGGALVIGISIGGFFAFILKKLIEKEEIIALAITAILLTAGLALLLGVSVILSCMVLGMIVINTFPQANKPVFEHMKSISILDFFLYQVF